MIGKGAHEIRPATLAEVVKILEKRQGTGGEFGFEQQTTLDYAKNFAHLKHSDAQQMQTELEKLEIKPETAVKIVDILPKNKSQLMLILGKDKVELSEKKISEVEALVAKFSEKVKKAPPKAEKEGAAADAGETGAKPEAEEKKAEKPAEKKADEKAEQEPPKAEKEEKAKKKEKAAKKK